jgi:lipoprotein signal peptidase
MSTKHSRLIIFSSGFLFILDQLLKYFARTNPYYRFYLWKHYLGWEYYLNQGIAFGIPFNNTLLVILIPIILVGLLFFYYKKNPSFCILFGLYLIFAGALSNLIDRSFYAMTIDYIRIFTSIINLSDVAIITGAILLISKTKTIKQC